MQPNSSEQRIYALDLLRAIAIVAVILYHFPRPETATAFRAISHFGLWGVDLFFILSGFLIGGQWFRSLEKKQTLLKSFYSRRLLRTLPNYYVMLLVVAALSWWNQTEQVSWHYWFFLQNLRPMTTLTHTWSLCVEEHFYLLFPVLGLVIWKQPRFATMSFFILFLTPLFSRMGLWYWLRPDLANPSEIHKTFWDYHTYLFYPTLTRIDTITLGVGLAYLQSRHISWWNQSLTHSNKWLATSLILLGVAAGMALQRFSFLGATVSFSFVGLGCAALLLGSLGTDSFLTRWKLPFIKTLALWSYSLYLTHLEAFSLAEYLRLQFEWAPYSLGTIVLEIACIGGCAWLLHILIEKPFLHLRDRIWGSSSAVDVPSMKKLDMDHFSKIS